MAYLKNVLVAADLLLNACCAGSPYETLSGRAWRMHEKGQRYWSWTAKAIDTIFFWQPNHCQTKHLAEVAAGLTTLTP